MNEETLMPTQELNANVRFIERGLADLKHWSNVLRHIGNQEIHAEIEPGQIRVVAERIHDLVDGMLDSYRAIWPSVK